MALPQRCLLFLYILIGVLLLTVLFHYAAVSEKTWTTQQKLSNPSDIARPSQHGAPANKASKQRLGERGEHTNTAVAARGAAPPRDLGIPKVATTAQPQLQLASILPESAAKKRFGLPAPVAPINKPGTAQDREDRYAEANFFPMLRNGLIIESGAFDGLTFSTTTTFQQERGWKAVHVEASPGNFALLQKNRPANDKTVNLNAALCKHEGMVHFVEPMDYANNPGAVCGIIEFMAPGFLDTFWPKHEDGKRYCRHNGSPAVLTPLPCHRLDTILEGLRVTHVDFWVLDVEGAELEVLETVDLRKWRIDVIVVELDGRNGRKDAAVRALLLHLGYLIHSTFPSRNTWFVRKDFFSKHFIPAPSSSSSPSSSAAAAPQAIAAPQVKAAPSRTATDKLKLPSNQ